METAQAQASSSLEEITRKAVPILKKNDVVRAGIFGSFARHEEREDSDVDFLIDFGQASKTLFDLVDLQDQLEKELNRKIHLAFYDYLKPRIRQQILDDEVPIL
ncbi:MAG: nucleotidyltransferase family protein [Deltaproteobacteria bacterium]|nr:nucleotidyltransferase family protein [Deltaproteobacteria bacterium]